MPKSSQTYQFRESTVRVDLANIIDATTQVIVSSDDDQLTMSGGVSRALLHAGGDAIREDADKQRPATVGQVVVTTAGRLEAKHIFHAITRHDGKPREEDPERNRETIASATQQCLQLLNRMNLTSIAFPALGAGYAGFKVEDVAVQMAEEVIKYLHFAKSPLSIQIYLRPEDVGQDVEFREFFNRFDERTGLTYKVVRDHAVVMIHGIRTDAAWFERLRNLLMRGDLQAAPVSAGYDYLDLLRFLLPVSFFRRAAVRRVKEKLDGVLTDKKIRRVSVIAHSFGTFIVGEMLKNDPNLRIHRLILCGSILPSTFDWKKHKGQIDELQGRDVSMQRVVNDCGWRDIWPVFAESVTWGYGHAGRFGFQTPWILDRFHNVGHSDFFDSKFVGDYWLPLISEGRVVEGSVERPPTTWWTRLLSVIKIRYLIVAALGAGGIAYVTR